LLTLTLTPIEILLSAATAATLLRLHDQHVGHFVYGSPSAIAAFAADRASQRRRCHANTFSVARPQAMMLLRAPRQFITLCIRRHASPPS